jgi:enoyl-CoA hydratase/carnithine racemase
VCPAIAVTEPGAGSDVAAIQTRAVRDGDEWVINGSKIYITNAATADWLCLLAVTDPTPATAASRRSSCPTDTPGFRYDLLDKIGNWGSDTGQLYFENVRVPIAYTIGEIGRGFQQQMMQFQDERLVGAISSIAAAQDNWEQTRAWAEQRILFGKPLSKMQVTQFKFVEMRHAADRGARAGLRVHPRAQPRRRRDAADHDGEDLLRARRALRRRRVHPALGRLRLHEGERRGPRVRRQPADQHRRRLRRDDAPLSREAAGILIPGGDMAEEVVHYERRGPAGWITLASPQTRNALSTQLVAELGAHLTAAIADPAVRAVVLTGEGPAFCAGADLKNRGAMGETSRGNPFVGILRDMRHGPKPVIVAVNGHAFGGGVGLVAAADIAIAADSAVFSFSEVRIGAIPAMISVVVLPKLGEHQTMRLFLTGERFDAARALGYGLLHRVVAPGELRRRCRRRSTRSRRAAPMRFARRSN